MPRFLNTALICATLFGGSAALTAEDAPKKTGDAAATAAAPAPVAKPITGTIVTAGDGKVVIKLAKKDGAEQTFTTNDKTVITVDGKVATLADLKQGKTVEITGKDSVAATINQIADAEPKEKKTKKNKKP